MWMDVDMSCDELGFPNVGARVTHDIHMNQCRSSRLSVYVLGLTQ